MKPPAPPARDTCAVILAGGDSKRFGGDKLSTVYEGEPVIAHVCRAASEVAARVYLNGRNRTRTQRLMRLAPGLVAGSIIDSDRACVGPANGIVTASRELACGRVLILPGDLPRLKGSLLRTFLSLSRANWASSIVWGGGMVESLIQLHGGMAAKVLSERVARFRGASARPTDMLRGAKRLWLCHARNLTRDPFALSNLNRLSDLDSPRPRGDFQGCVSEGVGLPGKQSALFWEAAEAFAAGRYERASALFELEGSLYSAAGVHHLAGHSLVDASRSAMLEGDRSRGALLAEAARMNLARMKAVSSVRPR